MDKDVLKILVAINNNLHSIATSLQALESDVEVAVLWANVREEDSDVDNDLYN